MTDKKIKLLFELCQELYEEEKRKLGSDDPLPYIIVKDCGERIIYSAWSIHSEKIEKKLAKLYD